jgi:hypothetical protein
MDQSEDTKEQTRDEEAISIMKSIKTAMAKEYEKDMEVLLARGQGMFLGAKQLQELQGAIGNVNAMVRLTNKFALLEKEQSKFGHDVHIAMRHAMEKLENVETIFTDNAY